MVIVTDTIAQDYHLVGNHLRAEVPLPTIILPTPCLKPSLDIYLLTFAKVLPLEMAKAQQAGEIAGNVVYALLISLVWPFYWITRGLSG